MTCANFGGGRNSFFNVILVTIGIDNAKIIATQLSMGANMLSSLHKFWLLGPNSDVIIGYGHKNLVPRFVFVFLERSNSQHLMLQFGGRHPASAVRNKTAKRNTGSHVEVLASCEPSVRCAVAHVLG